MVFDIWKDEGSLVFLRSGVICTTSNAERTRIIAKKKTYEFVGDVLWKKDGGLISRVVPKVEERIPLVQNVHIGLGHMRDKCLRFIRQRYYWSDLYGTVRRVIQSCEACQCNRVKWSTPKSLIQDPGPQRPFVGWALDLAQLPVGESGCKFIAVGVDLFTKFLVVNQISDKTSETLESWFRCEIVEKYKKPEYIRTDNGGEFGGAFSIFLIEKGIRHVHSRPLHPQSNGNVEATIGDIKCRMRCVLLEGNFPVKQWPRTLGKIVWSHNSAPHTTTCLSPFELAFGLKAFLTHEGNFQLRKSHLSMGELWNQANRQRNMVQARRQRAYMKKHARSEDLHFAVGDLVRCKLWRRRCLDPLVSIKVWRISEIDDQWRLATIESGRDRKRVGLEDLLQLD